MKRKWIGTLAVLVVLISVIVAGSLAYFQDTSDTKTNTFTMGKVKIELNEPEWDELTDEQKILVPGREIAKDPTVTVKGSSEACYVRVKVEIPTNLKAVLEDLVIDADKWTLTDGYYRYNAKVDKATADTVLPALFEKVQVKANADISDLGADDLNIKITAYAIQAEGFADANGAWTAWTD